LRKLASIKTISEIVPIANRDRIVLAIIDGWQVIVKKDEFNVGDKCVYCEIDSVMPDKPEFEFLKKNDFRIKTMKMAGVISQGICFPLSILPKGEYNVGDDVTSIIGVKQYEETMDIEKPERKPTAKKKYPKFLMRFAWFRKLVLPKPVDDTFPIQYISKSDQERIQNLPNIVKDKGKWDCTEKVDGSSASYLLVRKKKKNFFDSESYEFIVCSRNKKIPIKDNSSYWKVAEKFHIKQVLEFLIHDDDWIAIQGEVLGPGIQKNKYRFKDYEFRVFDMYRQKIGGKVDFRTMKTQVEAAGLKTVPLVETDYVLPDTVDDVLKYAHARSVEANIWREGIVFRKVGDGNKSFKAVDPEFLLKYDE